MTLFGPHDVHELRGIEARSLDKLRALAIAGQQTLAGAIDHAARVAGADVYTAVTVGQISNVAFEAALDRAMPRPGMRTPRPLGPVDTGSLELLRETMLQADTTLPQALTIVLVHAGIVMSAGRRIADLSAGELRAAIERYAAIIKPLPKRGRS